MCHAWVAIEEKKHHSTTAKSQQSSQLIVLFYFLPLISRLSGSVLAHSCVLSFLFIVFSIKETVPATQKIKQWWIKTGTSFFPSTNASQLWVSDSVARSTSWPSLMMSPPCHPQAVCRSHRVGSPRPVQEATSSSLSVTWWESPQPPARVQCEQLQEHWMSIFL